MGWQRHASRTRNLFFRDHVLLPSLPPAYRAMLRSQADIYIYIYVPIRGFDEPALRALCR